jgi:uncharacterized membrane protein
MNEPADRARPLIANYLDELSGLLAGIDPAERAEVIQGVREHLDSTLEGTAGTEMDVRAALAEVGPAQVVADEAYAGRPHGESPASPAPKTSWVWLPVVIAGLAFAMLPVIGYLILGLPVVNIGALLLITLAVLGGGTVVGVLVRRAYRRSTAVTST